MNYAGDRAFLSYLPPRAQTESRKGGEHGKQMLKARLGREG